MTVTRSRTERGVFPSGAEHCGHSLLGAPLIWFLTLVADRESGLALAGTHGDKSSSVVTLLCALHTLSLSLRRRHVVLTVNPDGCQLRPRVNTNGVGLNRDFPTADWRTGETTYRQNNSAEERDVVLLTGEGPGSEPGTQTLCQLIHRTHSVWVVSFHDPLACIEDPGGSELGSWLAQSFELPLVTSVGYGTPGSSGSWYTDLNLHRITAKFPPISSGEASEKYLPAMFNPLRWHPRDGAARS